MNSQIGLSVYVYSIKENALDYRCAKLTEFYENSISLIKTRNSACRFPIYNYLLQTVYSVIYLLRFFVTHYVHFKWLSYYLFIFFKET